MIKVTRDKTELEGSALDLLAEATLVVKRVSQVISGKTNMTQEQVVELITVAVKATDLFDKGMSPQEAVEELA